MLSAKVPAKTTETATRSTLAQRSFPSLQKKMIKHTPNHFQKATGFLRESLPETLSQGFKPVALEIYEFEERRNMKIIRTRWHFRTLKIPIEDTQSEILPAKKQLKKYDHQFRP